MSSSESDDDDCYGNVAQKLQKMKNTFADDKSESSFMKASTELDDIVKNAGDLQTKTIVTHCSPVKTLPANSDNIVGTLVNHINVSANIEVHEPGNRPVTRSRTSNCTTELDIMAGAVPLTQSSRQNEPSVRRSTTSRGRGRGRRSNVNDANVNDTNISVQDIPTPTPPRGRRERRSRRGFSTASNTISSMIPIYSVGNTYEYPDQSENQQLFSVNTTRHDVIVIDEENPLEDNEEMSVKVYWQSCDYFRFPIRKFQKLKQIFDFFSNKENISPENLLFLYNDKIITQDDTPDSIQYSIAKFIEGGTVTQRVSQTMSKNKETIKNGIKVKFQCQNVKKPLEMFVSLDESLLISMIKCAEHIEKPLEKLRFIFDGDTVSGKSTPRELDLEGGECFDVKILS